MQKEKELIPQLYRTEFRKLVSVLSRSFGLEHIELAEDIVSEAFLTAAETWGIKGIPNNPVAWLYTVAKNTAKDQLKRHNLFEGKITTYLQQDHNTAYETEIDLSTQNIRDSQLQMMFAICHPVIPPEAQIGLSLRILCGFSIDEIADAFLTNKENINKRLFRARQKLKEARIAIEVPPVTEIDKRIETVLTTVYLLFNEGYYSQSHNAILRRDLCLEAMRLNYLLLENPATNTPAVNALMALMCFHSSRFDSRLDEHGEVVLYDDQDSSLWNQELIAKGNYYLNMAARGDTLSTYHLEAGIAYWHTNRSAEKWQHILQLYNKLLQLRYSPIAALNRTYALYKVYGKAAAIAEAEKLKLDNSHLYHCLLGNLYTDEDNQKAIEHYNTAIKLTKSSVDKKAIRKQMIKIGTL
ncbi:RNA polymerase subunit sigma [Mucilaginibacter sp. PPCGB 2223]|uniref:RNA polymerase sigma factor n=1 Tax=Mucilaginibacter sp. PPCGB 2223 TaxID=1886027 RepID=UPI000825A2ED|nr:sigma-70 family RNA polymerase sigma factor [Mucilaginibacter sp. PPCGB 2223]OCX53304.1 RNA polymerase subunit sigma [Mucilaginibacter sp. PPCGB 2223]